MIVVSDTSPLNYLILIRQIDILPRLFVEIVAPPTVVTELKHSNSPQVVRDWACSPPDWLEIQSPTRLDSSIKLDEGEVAAISLALERGADQLLVDDGRARSAALARGIRVTGTLAVLNEAAERGMIVLRNAITALQQTNFRASPAVWAALLRDQQ